MALPAYVKSSAGTVITTGSTAVSLASVTVGNFIILQILTDGTGGDSATPSSPSNINDLTGAAGISYGAAAAFSGQAVGSPTAATQILGFGRASGTTPTITVAVNGAGDDLYVVMHEFSGVASGTLISDVIENGSAGAIANGAGTSVTVADTGVTTLGADRLALNFVGINDDLTGIAAFAGASGGTWAMPKSFESSTGTDGTVSLMTANMASAGTINGGTDTITSDGWGVIGFALKSPAAAAFVARPVQMEWQQAVGRASTW